MKMKFVTPVRDEHVRPKIVGNEFLKIQLIDSNASVFENPKKIKLLHPIVDVLPAIILPPFLKSFSISRPVRVKNRIRPPQCVGLIVGPVGERKQRGNTISQAAVSRIALQDCTVCLNPDYVASSPFLSTDAVRSDYFAYLNNLLE